MDDLDALYDQLDAYADSIRAKDRLIEQQASRIAGLEASRIAYASEFPPDAEGLPDVGNIHANIRAMKRDAESWRAHMREVERVQDLERGGFGRDAALAQGEEG